MLDSVPLHVQILAIPAARQDESPLFNTLPAEVRTEIFSLALADYPDEARYDLETYYSRPSYFAPRKSDTRLLRTCRAIYSEAWFLPFVLKEQTHWLTTAERAPPEYSNDIQDRLPATLEQITKQHGGGKVEIKGLHVFAQMWSLEANDLRWLLRTPNLHPRCFTLTIRHTDWWWWEQDYPLSFQGNWIEVASELMPSSVREVRIELESLERKKEQIDFIAKQMTNKWFFKRVDGTALFANTAPEAIEIDRWTGTSTWNGHTWHRDEARPDQIDYYIATVVFRPLIVVERLGGEVSEVAKRAANASKFDYTKLNLRFAGKSTRPGTFLGSIYDEGWDEGGGWEPDE